MSGFALVLGLSQEPPVAAVARALAAAHAPHLVLDQRRLVAGNIQTWWTPGRPASAGSPEDTPGGTAGGVIEVDGRRVPLEAVTGVYTRLAAWGDLPEVARAPALLAHVQAMHVAIEAWLETTAACVVNRTSANDSNSSKPYQALIIRDHFAIPATLVTNNPDAVATFRCEFGRIIYKSISGERSIVTEFGAEDVARLHLLQYAPVQFQEYVPGVDVRVHVVGTEVFATCVESDAVDYRYDRSGRVRMRAVDIAPAVAAECVALTRRLGLELSGIDLRYADDGRIVCFEVNPSPAYIVYEAETGQPIAAAIARLLLDG